MGAADALRIHAPSIVAAGMQPSPGQQPGELQAACAAQLATPGGVWPAPAPDVAAALRRLAALAALLQDRLAEVQSEVRRLTDPTGTAGGWVLDPRAAAQVDGRHVAGLPAGPGRDAADAMLYTPV